MNKMKKFALIAVCAALLVCVTISATVAYLTSTAKVENTFTVGKVAITLDETKVNSNGLPPIDPEQRVSANAYHLLPGQSYLKNPTVHVDKDSETCYVFVKVENGIAALEAASTDARPNIAAQIASNGWIALDGVPNVYYKEYTKNPVATEDTDLLVFSMFTIADNADTLDAWSSVNTNTKVTVTAYAIQEEGFANNVLAAWAEVSK